LADIADRKTDVRLAPDSGQPRASDRYALAIHFRRSGQSAGARQSECRQISIWMRSLDDSYRDCKSAKIKKSAEQELTAFVGIRHVSI